MRRQLPPEIGDRVAALKLPGIGLDKEYRRYYPTGEMTAHVVGFTGVDDKGPLEKKKHKDDTPAEKAKEAAKNAAQ